MDDRDVPSRAEFDRLYEHIDNGFRGVHDRLDTLNGRTRKIEVDSGQIHTRLHNVEKEVFQRRRTDKRTDGDPDRLFTKREAALATVGIAIISAMWKLIVLLGGSVIDFATKKAMHP
jgi:hypothetical protein